MLFLNRKIAWIKTKVILPHQKKKQTCKCEDGLTAYSLSITAESIYSPLLYQFYVTINHPMLLSESFGNLSIFGNVFDSQSSKITESISCVIRP